MASIPHLKPVDVLQPHELRPEFDITRTKLHLTTRQIRYLDSQILYLRKLFKRAEKNNNYAILYNLRMQLSISSGVKVMYQNYFAFMETRIEQIKMRLDGQVPNTVSNPREPSHLNEQVPNTDSNASEPSHLNEQVSNARELPTSSGACSKKM
ncbi:uncharacterized protein CEXT_496721 [Caerostris extrusa]|uniref:Uncharacterized protein n=1 Tax=Caerostris extrusa TaxID=172846 RepID=A0AAV4VLJ6_CAEEX|nr:uncharacterized protein CEXT_496721 [Caerostris extrusa]